MIEPSSSPWTRTWPAGWHVEYVDETGSTNADLLATATARPDRSVLATGHQTAGRGRLDRRWDAPPGANLLVSLLFHEPDPAPAGELVRRVSLAALDACRRQVPEVAVGTLALKWPNDLLLGDRKLAGVLAERRTDPPVIVVGTGINVGWAPDGAARLGDAVEPAALLAALLTAFDRLPADAAAFHRRYRDDLATLARAVRVERGGDTLEGRAVDVGTDGALQVLDTCGATHRIDAGDVTHLRHTGPAPAPGTGT